jgi:hypothetical protein
MTTEPDQELRRRVAALESWKSGLANAFSSLLLLAASLIIAYGATWLVTDYINLRDRVRQQTKREEHQGSKIHELHQRLKEVEKWR